LKYFCEQTPDYHIVAAGSLLGVKLAHSKGFPVGKVNFLQLHPMGFLEFLQALGKEQLYQHLNQIEKIAPLEDSIHQDLCDLLKTYLFVGGMPEAVKTYQQTQDFHATRQVHEEIIKAYSLDFAKHAPKNQLMKVSLIWESLPAQLAKENKKFVFSKMKPGARTREYETALQWLIDTGLIYPAYNLSTPKLPLKAYQDSSAFKLYCLDVGLLGAMSELSAQTLLDGDKLFTEFKGAISENLAAQLLTIQGTQQLYYWSSGNTAEVDFIIRTNNEIQPLEIKAGTSNKKKSLLVYDNKYQPTQLNRGSLLNLRRDGRLNNYPLYLLEKFPFN
jgi:predicted AAA+ superfamily ATPase